MPTREFQHYDGCNHNDPENCSGCALTDTKQDAPNYAGWPLAYLENKQPIPAKWRQAFVNELGRIDNPAYVENLYKAMAKYGIRFTDSPGVLWPCQSS